MELSILLLIVSCAANLFIGALVLLRNPRRRSSILFGLISLFTALWSASNYLVEFSFGDIQINKVLNVLAYFFAMTAIISIVTFTFSFQPDSRSRRIFNFLKFTFPVALIFSLLPQAHGSVHADNGELAFQNGTLAGLYVLIILAYVVFIVFHLSKVAKSSDKKIKNQARTILFGLAGTVILIALVNSIIPLATGSFATAKLGPLCTIVMIYAFAYAIVKHKLFDIRLIFVRTVGYALSLGTIFGIFFLLVLFLAREIYDDNSIAMTPLVIPLLIAILLGLAYPQIKRFYDKQTSRLFYRDAYEPQNFLDELNNVLVGNIEIGILLRHTAMVIGDNLKAECHIFVNDTETSSSRLLGTSQKHIQADILKLIKDELATLNKKTVVADELEMHYSGLREALERNDIAIISSLVTSYAANREATAYLMLGPKKSGNSYSKQDLRIINIITDELLIAVQNALRFEEIQSFNITLQKRINDATAKLKRSNEKLREMDETKDEFISMASHQLRTPLTSVKGYLSMVLDGDAGDVGDNQKELLNQAYVSAQRMVYLIADLLNVSRLKTGKFVIDSAPTDLAEMVESEMSQLTEVAKSRNLTLTFDKPKDLPKINLDETKTRQVVMNFIDNAIYYTPSGGKIKIELKSDRSSIYFIVKDNGMGVPNKDQAQLFTKFYRAGNAQKARPDGTGLGLFMAKKVITEQGGTILFESTEGKGSTFGFKFDMPSDKSTDS